MELTKYMALMAVQAEEAEHRRDVIESGDGRVIEHGRDEDNDWGDDGAAE